MSEIFDTIDRIAKDIQKQKDDVLAMEFTNCIGTLLKKNGVTVDIDEYKYANMAYCQTTISQKYGVFIKDLDFTEHDKPFLDKITEMKSEISTLKSLIDNYSETDSDACDEIIELKAQIAELRQELARKEIEKEKRIEFIASNGEQLTPLEVANSLINKNVFKVDDLKELAEFLNVYYRHHCDKK